MSQNTFFSFFLSLQKSTKKYIYGVYTRTAIDKKFFLFIFFHFESMKCDSQFTCSAVHMWCVCICGPQFSPIYFKNSNEPVSVFWFYSSYHERWMTHEYISSKFNDNNNNRREARSLRFEIKFGIAKARTTHICIKGQIGYSLKQRPTDIFRIADVWVYQLRTEIIRFYFRITHILLYVNISWHRNKYAWRLCRSCISMNSFSSGIPNIE